MVTRQTFFIFHYDRDSWRAAQVRQMGALNGNEPVSDNDWETVTPFGDLGILLWINDQMKGKSCAIVLIGSHTAGRKWVNYEIRKAWKDGKGLLGIYIHNLKDVKGDQSIKGKNPFDLIQVDGTKLSSIVKAYDPPYKESTWAHFYVKGNIAEWVEDAIRIRQSR